MIGVDKFAAQLADKKGVRIVAGPVTRGDDVRVLLIEDCNGFVLAFGEDVADPKDKNTDC